MKDFNYPIMNPESDIPSLLGFTNDKIMHYINRQNHNLDHFRNEFSRLRHQNDKLQRMLVKSVLNITYSEPLTFDEITSHQSWRVQLIPRSQSSISMRSKDITKANSNINIGVSLLNQ